MNPNRDVLLAAAELLGGHVAALDVFDKYTLTCHVKVKHVKLSVREQELVAGVVNAALSPMPDYRRIFCSIDRSDAHGFSLIKLG